MTDEAFVKDKDIVVPGDKIASGMGFLPGKGTYRSDSDIFAERVGLVHIDGNVIKLVPLSGAYMPKVNDRVIGKIIDVLMSGWRIDFGSPYSAVLSMKEATSEFIPKGADLTRYFAIDDFIVCKIINVTSQRLVDVSMMGPGLRKLKGGRFVNVNTNKVPRIIGKEGSMVSMIKQATGCNIIIGQNGMVWIDGEPENEVIAVEAIKLVEAEAHKSGLTDRVSKFLEEKTGKKVEAVQNFKKR
ncbi:MAG TPA: RNA-binding protein [Candidatus Woesearchaeota archaeon]|nr:MAG: RNA-binding protein [Candidatus Woesearchaeota archaeon]HDD70888.1 RNA-binding protein [Candidatus Woesearchaeota archaeon]